VFYLFVPFAPKLSSILLFNWHFKLTYDITVMQWLGGEESLSQLAGFERFPWMELKQACTTQTARRAKLLSTQICRGPQTSISFRCGDFVVVWKKFWNNNYLFEVELL